jgi:hypothetical protein
LQGRAGSAQRRAGGRVYARAPILLCLQRTAHLGHRHCTTGLRFRMALPPRIIVG